MKRTIKVIIIQLLTLAALALGSSPSLASALLQDSSQGRLFPIAVSYQYWSEAQTILSPPPAINIYFSFFDIPLEPSPANILGGWTPFFDQNFSTPHLEDYIFGFITLPLLHSGDNIYATDGISLHLLSDIQQYLAEGNPNVLLPVVDNGIAPVFNFKAGMPYPIIGFAGFHIDGTNPLSHRYIYGHFNDPPMISGTPPASVIPVTPYFFAPTASDADGDTLTFSISNKPPWAVFSPATGALDGMPGPGEIGTYANIVISVSDGGFTAALPPFSITVSPPDNSVLTWQQTGVATDRVFSIAIDPTNSQVVYAGTKTDGAYKSTNGGVSWTHIDGLANATVYSLVLDPNNSQTIYAGTNFGAYKSTDGGIYWNGISSGLTYFDVYCLAFDPSNSQIIYAGTAQGVYKTINGGASWDYIYGLSAKVFTLAVDPTDSRVIYAGTFYSGVYKSTNGGDTWSAVNTGLTSTFIQSFAIDPTDSQTVYAGTYSGGLFKSTNGGAFWTHIGMESQYATSLAIDPTDSQTLYTGTWGIGVFKTTDGGGTWSAANTGLTSPYVCTVTIDPTNSRTLYAGTDSGIFKTMTYTLAGRITSNGAGLAGVSLSGATCTVTDSSGAYSCTVDPGWGGLITPALAGYTFTPALRGYYNISANQTSQDYMATPVAYLLTVTKSGSGGGTVIADSGDLVWSGNSATGTYNYGNSVILTAVSDTVSIFGGWSGPCVPSGADCTVSMTTGRSVIATFTAAPKAMIGATGYASLNSAYNAATGGAVILLLDTDLMESLTLNLGTDILVTGGYNAAFSGRTGEMTGLNGVLTIGTGSLTVDGLAVK